MLSERLKQERINANFTQKNISDKVEISEISYNRYENNQRTPTLEIISKIADVFDCSVDYLLGRTDKREVNR